ncbi:MAG: type II toxin-antitoxin system VapC family toxin [Spirulina sp. SIO3F2]|nr:type II toxin-antitoxin system VapC family toxin [Spirulina sp. SIO3F2]
MYLLDTDILIDVLRGHEPALDWFVTLDPLPHLTGFVVMELLQGAQNKVKVRQVEQLGAPLPMIWPTPEQCNNALVVFSTHHLTNSLGLIDALIAACAIGNNATLCTFNVKHYKAIAGLRTLQPYSR